MRLWFVTPCWRRPLVTRLALAQRRELCDTLAAHGITADCVIVADDENTAVAAEYGFPVIETGNEYLGRKVNTGFGYALDHGADVIAFTGSDSWVHADLILNIDDRILTGRRMAHIDLERGVYNVLNTSQRFGVTPWFIPADRIRLPLVPDEKNKGMEFWMHQNLKGGWKFSDPHPFCRVELKSSLNMTPYLGGTDPAWEPLADHYPRHLVDMARETHLALAA